MRLWTAIAAVTLLVSFAAFGLSYRYQMKQLGDKGSNNDMSSDTRSSDVTLNEGFTEDEEDSDEQKEE